MHNETISKKILLVDDEIIALLAHKTPLIQSGFIVDEARSGQEAIKKFAANPNKYDIVLIDYNMPDMNGASVCEELRRIEKNWKTHTTIIAVTAHADEKIKSVCLKSGMDKFISKPVLAKDLIRMIANF